MLVSGILVRTAKGTSLADAHRSSCVFIRIVGSDCVFLVPLHTRVLWMSSRGMCIFIQWLRSDSYCINGTMLLVWLEFEGSMKASSREYKQVCWLVVASGVVACRCTCNHCAAVLVFMEQAVAMYSFKTCTVCGLDIFRQSIETMPCIPRVQIIKLRIARCTSENCCNSCWFWTKNIYTTKLIGDVSLGSLSDCLLNQWLIGFWCHNDNTIFGEYCQCKISLPTQVYMVVYEDLGYLRR